MYAYVAAVSLARLVTGGSDAMQAAVQGHHARANFGSPCPQGVQEKGGIRARAEGGVRARTGQQAAQGKAEGMSSARWSYSSCTPP